VPLSQHLRPLLQRVAAAHPESKFLSIPAGMCIANYPDKNVPTLLIYRNGEISGNVVAGQGLRGMKTTVQGRPNPPRSSDRADKQIWNGCVYRPELSSDSLMLSGHGGRIATMTKIWTGKLAW